MTGLKGCGEERVEEARAEEASCTIDADIEERLTDLEGVAMTLLETVLTYYNHVADPRTKELIIESMLEDRKTGIISSIIKTLRNIKDCINLEKYNTQVKEEIKIIVKKMVEIQQ